MDISLEYTALLIGTGIVAGIVNTLAGGGSNLTLPVLMMMGLPADIANATNRVGVLLQNFTAAVGFKQHDKLPSADLGWIVLPTLLGGVVGAVAATFAPTTILKPLLLGTMLLLTVIMLIRPEVVSPPVGTAPFTVREKPAARWTLLLAGFYGGFVQAGVGFILITAIAGTLRYDLIRTNAIKVVCLVAFTLAALILFAVRGQVLWLPGLILACGTILGAHLGVKCAIKASPESLKWFLFLMTLVACAGAMWF